MRILITGASGKLGSYLLQELSQQDEAVTAWSHRWTRDLFGIRLQSVDLSDPRATATAFHQARPELIVHTAAVSSVEACFRNQAAAEQVNTRATAQLAQLAAAHRARLLFVSTDMVFDGQRGGYGECDPPAPLSTYGRLKVAAESAVLQHAGNVVVRVSLLFGTTLVDRPAFFDQLLLGLRQQSELKLFRDEWRTPLGLRAAARHLLLVGRSNQQGILHLGGPERMSRLEMGQRLADHLGLDRHVLTATDRASVAAAEPRPADLSLDTTRWRTVFPDAALPNWETALNEMGLGSPG